MGLISPALVWQYQVQLISGNTSEHTIDAMIIQEGTTLNVSVEMTKDFWHRLQNTLVH